MSLCEFIPKIEYRIRHESTWKIKINDVYKITTIAKHSDSNNYLRKYQFSFPKSDF